MHDEVERCPQRVKCLEVGDWLEAECRGSVWGLVFGVGAPGLLRGRILNKGHAHLAMAQEALCATSHVLLQHEKFICASVLPAVFVVFMAVDVVC